MISWKDLLLLLPNVKNHKSNNMHQFYDKYEFVWSDINTIDENCIYILSEDSVSRFGDDDMASVIILTSNFTEYHIPDTFLNCLVVNKEESQMLGCVLSESFQKQKCIRNECNILFEMVTKNKGLQAMTDEFSDFMGRPIAVLDNTYRFVVCSKQEEMDSYVEEKDRDYIGITQERIKLLIKTGVIEQSKSQSVPQYYEVDNFTIYHTPLYVNNVNVAVLGIAGSKKLGLEELPPEYVNELDRIGKLFSIELAKMDLFALNGKKNLPYVFSLILEQEPEDIEYIRERLKLFDYKLLPNMFLLSIPIGNREESTILTIADTLKRVFINSMYMIRQQELLFLISRPQGKELSDFELNVWNSQLKGYGLSGGLSTVFTNFKGIRTTQLKQANLALDAGRKIHPDNALYRFEDYQVDAMIVDVVDKENLSLFCFDALMKLKEHDINKESNLITTLKEYMKNSKKPREVCENLYIHKNTLYKRLSKISEIMNCDLNDPEIIMKIQLTFHILDIMETK